MNTSNISSSLDSILNKILMQAADKIAGDVRSGAPTARVRANVNISQVIGTSEGKQIIVYVPLSKETGAPEARAYEYGSGIHSKAGQKYSIDHKNYPNLVFYWEREQKWFVGPHVDHPGVAARPYFGPALDKNRVIFHDLLIGEVVTMIRAVIDTGIHE